MSNLDKAKKRGFKDILKGSNPPKGKSRVSISGPFISGKDKKGQSEIMPGVKVRISF